MKGWFFIVAILIQFVNTGFAQPNFETEINHLLEKPDYESAIVGIRIEDLKNDEIVFDLNGDKLLIPASTLKLITTATALEILGSNYRFKTLIGYTGKIKDEKLEGDLVVIGGGDPTLGSEYFESENFNPHFLDVWAEKIREAGVQKVNGNLVMDASIYDTEKIPDTWIWEDMGNYYGAGANAFTVYDNLFRINFSSPKRAGELTRIISIEPNIKGLEFNNEVISSDINKDLAYVFGSPLDKTRIIKGSIPKNRNSFIVKASIPKPEELLAEDLLKHLAQKGVFVSGKIVFDKAASSKINLIYINESPALSEIVKVLNFESVNLFAEHLLKQISAEKTGIGNRENSIELISEYWKSKGFPVEKLIMEDGSGLSHFNAVTPEFFVSVLKYMYHSENSDVFQKSLPGAGDGTLTGFNKLHFPDESIKAKSGSMTRVRCYVGYLKTDSGKDFCFSVMFNQFIGSQSQIGNEIENILLDLRKFY